MMPIRGKTTSADVAQPPLSRAIDDLVGEAVASSKRIVPYSSSPTPSQIDRAIVVLPPDEAQKRVPLATKPIGDAEEGEEIAPVARREGIWEV